MRFIRSDIVFDDDIEEGSDCTEFCGYMWATDVFCKIAGYNGEIGTDDFINLYPTYNVETDEFYVIASMVEGVKDTEEKLELTVNETDAVFNKFVEHYWETKENFNDFVKQWKEKCK